MKIPTIHGLIDRRILVNFVADPDVIRPLLPAPFTPKLYRGKAIVGICLIRLKNIRPKGFPAFTGFSSENGAHRIAVEWESKGKQREGVYIPRRDTSSAFNALVGGRIFPGRHYKAEFTVRESDGRYEVGFTSSDSTSISIDARKTGQFPPDSVFGTLDNVSDFFLTGATGFSPNGKKLDGLKLTTDEWKMDALEVSAVHSSFFEDQTLFPAGTVKFDNAVLMTGISHQWNQVEL